MVIEGTLPDIAISLVRLSKVYKVPSTQQVLKKTRLKGFQSKTDTRRTKGYLGLEQSSPKRLPKRLPTRLPKRLPQKAATKGYLKRLPKKADPNDAPKGSPKRLP